MTTISPTNIMYAESFNKAVNSVCKEGKFLSNATGFKLEDTMAFLTKMIANNDTQMLALENNNVVGWCDVVAKPQEFHRHVGVLGMGVIKSHRGQGLGTKLIKATIESAAQKGIKKIELEVFASNKVAQSLYKKVGFEIEGVKKKSKFFQGKYEDVMIMGLCL